MTEQTSVHINQAIKFIKAYRAFEKAKFQDSEAFIRKVVKPDYTASHLVSSWRGRKKDFSDFFLNLSHVTQARFLEAWGIEVSGLEDYVKRIEGNTVAALFETPPQTANWLHDLTKFFYNHSISGLIYTTVDGFKVGFLLPDLPDGTRQYGNSKNWGDYILRLSESNQCELLDFLYKMSSQNNE